MERPRTPDQLISPGLGLSPVHEMTRDQRLQARTLHVVRQKYTDIHKFFQEKKKNITYRQICYACKTRATPQKRSGRPLILTTNQVDELIEFISLLKTNRRMAFWRVTLELGWEGVQASAIRSALRRVGYKVYSIIPSLQNFLTILQRYVALHKPPILEKNQKLRLEFALEYVNQTDEQQDAILWSDETWVTPSSYRKTWVTRRADEALDPTCIVEREPKKHGWMFWGCFSGKAGKGPGIFQEKDQGSINAESY